MVWLLGCSVDEMGRVVGRQQGTVDIYVLKLDSMLDVRPSMRGVRLVLVTLPENGVS